MSSTIVVDATTTDDENKMSTVNENKDDQKSDFLPERMTQELDKLHELLLKKMTNKQSATSKLVSKYEKELDYFRTQVQQLSIENYTVSTCWPTLIDDRIKVIEREQQSRQKLIDHHQHRIRRETEIQRRKEFHDQQAKDKKDFGTSSYYSMALLRLQLRESEVRRELESNALTNQLELSQRFEKGYNTVWRKFSNKMEKEMRLLEQLLASQK